MLRNLIIVLSVIFALTALSLHNLNQTDYLVAATKDVKNAKQKPERDKLKVKVQDLIEDQQGNWQPDLSVDPHDFIEEMELPERARAEDDSTATS